MQSLDPEPPVQKWFVLNWFLQLSVPVQIALIAAIAVLVLALFALIALHPTILNDLITLLKR